MAQDPLLALADELYAEPPAAFTPRRDALAKELKGSKRPEDKELSVAVKALRKPSLAAWVVDLLVRREAAQVEQVLAVGEALREAQANLAGEQLRALTRQRRQLTAAVTTRARSLAGEYGIRVTGSVAEQVEATLTAAILDAGAAEAVRSGLLVASLSATGVGGVEVEAALAVPQAIGFSPRATGAAEAGGSAEASPELRVVPDPDAEAKALAAAREALAEAEAEESRAQEALEAAGRGVSDAEARTLQVQGELDELRRRLAELETAAEEADDELSDAEDARAEAQSELARATAAREAAATKVKRARGGSR